MSRRPFLLALLLLPSLWPGLAAARTVYRCVQGNTVSLATAPEPGSRCTPKEIDDNAIQAPNLWGNMGVFSGVLYEREQDGVLVLLSLQADTRQALIASPAWFVLLGVGYWVRRRTAK